MKLGITSSGENCTSEFNPRFGRCAYFIIIDSETHAWEAIHNPAADSRGGAGPQAAQFIINKDVEAVISGRYGPTAHSALRAGQVRTFIAKGGTVQDVFEKFLDGKLKQVASETGPEIHARSHRR